MGWMEHIQTPLACSRDSGEKPPEPPEKKPQKINKMYFLLCLIPSSKYLHKYAFVMSTACLELPLFRGFPNQNKQTKQPPASRDGGSAPK